MSNVLAPAAYRLASATGLHLAARSVNRRKLLVVVYHGVSTEPPPLDIPGWHLVSVDQLHKQIEYLTKHYEILPIDEAIDGLARGSLGPRTACVTFDDGYENNATVAFPVLERFSAPATIYLATGLVDTDRRLWTLRLEIAFRRSELQTLDLALIGLGVRRMNGLRERVHTAHHIIRVLKKMSPASREATLARLHSLLPDDGSDAAGVFRMMSWSEAAALEATGLITFGAHTVNHELVAMLDDETLRTELSESVAAIHSRFRRPSRTFAYPNGAAGDFDSRAIGILRGLGVKAAVTTIHGLNRVAADPFTLRRVTVDGYTSFDRFRLITSGLAVQGLAWMRR